MKAGQTIKNRNWIKPTITLIVMLLLAWLLPVAALDPWGLLSLKKIAIVIFALTFIQAIGSTLAYFLGARIGAILTGFFGGLISSTATTAALARNSKVSEKNDAAIETLTFLSATAAMLLEATSLVLLATDSVHFELLLIFLGPLMATAGMIFVQSRKLTHQSLNLKATEFEILPILKLSAFIIGILALSKILQIFMGHSGLLILTFIVSLFEIHGSIIANIQLHSSGAFDFRLLGDLLATSIVASYISKVFLISKLGSAQLIRRTIKCTVILFASLVISWLIFLLFV